MSQQDDLTSQPRPPGKGGVGAADPPAGASADDAFDAEILALLEAPAAPADGQAAAPPTAGPATEATPAADAARERMAATGSGPTPAVADPQAAATAAGASVDDAFDAEILALLEVPADSAAGETAAAPAEVAAAELEPRADADGEPAPLAIAADAAVAAGEPGAGVPPPIADSPLQTMADAVFPGMQPLDASAAEALHGREQDVAQLVRDAAERPLTAIVGSSGIGKTSLLQAGLLARLERNQPGRWQAIHLRLGADPDLDAFQSLGAALTPHFMPASRGDRRQAARQVGDDLSSGAVSLARVLDDCRSARPDVTFVLVLDNFESIFQVNDVALRRRFIDCLLAAFPPTESMSSAQARLLLIMRSEALGPALAYAPLAAALHGALRHVMPLSRESLRHAIVEPAQRHGVTFADDLLSSVLDSLEEDAGRLPRLQFCLREMWLQRSAATLDAGRLAAIGGLEGAVERQAEQLWAQHTRDGADVKAAQAFRGLFGVLHAAPERDIDRKSVGDEAWQLALEIARAQNPLLISRVAPSGEARIGLAHESALIVWQRPADWRLEDDLFGRWQAGMTPSFEAWRRDQGNEALLLSGALLAQAEDWFARRPDSFDRPTRRFVEKSIEARVAKDEEQRRSAEREVEQAQQMRTAADDLAEARSREAEEGVRRVRRNRLIATAAIGLSVASVALTFLSWLQTRSAVINAYEAERRVATVTHEAQAASQREATSRAQTEAAVTRIRAIALDRSAILTGMANREIANGRPTVGLLLALQARQADGEGLKLDELPALAPVVERARYAGVPLSTFRVAASNLAAAWSPDGRHVATAASDRSASLWDAQSNQRIVSFAGHAAAVLRIVFSPDGQHVATASEDGTARLWDAATGQELVQYVGHGGAVTDVAISADGRWLATASDDRTARVWDRATGAVVQTFIGHGGAVRSVAFAPDGKRIATASADRTARIWEILSGAELRQLTGHAQPVTAIRFTADGRRLLTASADRTIRIWDADRGSEQRVLSGHTDAVIALDLAKDGKLLASASEDRSVRIWNLDTGETVHTLSDVAEGIRGMAMTSNAGMLAIVATDGSVHLVGASGGRPVQRLVGHTSDVLAAAATAQGKQLVTTGGDKTLRLWDVDTGHELRAITQPAPARAVSFAADGRHFATGSDDRNVRLWTIDGDAGPVVLGGHAAPVVAVSFSADGRRIASLAQDAVLKVWDVAAGRELRSLSVPPATAGSPVLDATGQRVAIAAGGRILVFDTNTGHELRSLAVPDEIPARLQFSPNAALLASGGVDGTVRLYDTQSWTKIRSLAGDPAVVASLDFSADSSRLLVGLAGGRFALWSLDAAAITQLANLEGSAPLLAAAFVTGGRRLLTVTTAGDSLVWDVERGHELTRVTGHTAAVTKAVVFADGRQLLTVSEDRTARIVDLETGAELRRLPEHPRGIVTAAVSGNGERMATALPDGSIRLWDGGGKPLRTLGGHGRAVRDLAFNLTGDRLVSASEDRTIRIWDAQTGGEIRKLGPQAAAVFGVALSADGGQIASGSADAVARIWDIETGRQVRPLVGHRAAIRDVAYSPDGQRIATASEDGTVRVWNAASGQEQRVLASHGKAVVAVAFSPDSTRIASVSEDRTLRLWDVVTGMLLQTFVGHADQLTSVAFVPDGRRIVTASLDRSVRIWGAFAGNDAWLPADLARLRPLMLDERRRFLGAE